MKKTVTLLLALLFCCLPLTAAAEKAADLPFCYLQTDDRWASVKIGSLTIAESGCGIAGICNAVYFLTGRRMDLKEVAEKAHEKHYYNTDSVAGVYRSVFLHSAEWYGKEYGYAATEFLWEPLTGDKLLTHIRNGGTAVLHVPGHFITLIDYDPENRLYLVIDPLPGDIGRYDRRRAGLTHTGGDWLTAETLSSGYLKTDGYVLFSRILTDDETESVKTAAVRGLRRY